MPTTSVTPPVNYTVQYSSDGHIQFQETWAVPSSAAPLRVRDVRLAANLVNPPGDSGGSVVPVQESDVVGLITDLGSRPMKGSGYTAGRVATVDSSGALETALGSSTDCVHVDGSSGPCGGDAPAFVDQETPTGTVDGTNATFSLSAQPAPTASLMIYRNGVALTAGLDYNLAGQTVQFLAGAVPQPGDTLSVSYRLSSALPSAPTVFPSAQVLCVGTGATTGSIASTSIGTCTIPASTLAAGDHVEIQFVYEHDGSNSGFSIGVQWGNTTVLARDAAIGDALVAGRIDAGLDFSGAAVSAESWGTVLPLGVTVASATDSFSGALTINFLANVAAGGDTVTLRNFSVVLMP